MSNLAAIAATQSTHQTIPLNTSWQFRQMDSPDAQWPPATVPSDVEIKIISRVDAFAR